MGSFVMRRTVGRPPKQGEILSVERQIKFAPSMHEALDEKSRATGITVAELVRRAVAKDLEAEEKSAPAPNQVIMTFDLDTLGKLGKLGSSLGLRPVNAFIDFLCQRAVHVSRQELSDFLYGDFFKNAEAAEAQERRRLDAQRDKRDKQNGKAA